MADASTSSHDIDALASKLDTMQDQFDDRDHVTLQAVFRLAGRGFAAAEAEAAAEAVTDDEPASGPDVEGFTFKLTPDKVEAGGEQIRRAGLGLQFSLGRGHHPTTTPATPPGVPIPYPNVSS